MALALHSTPSKADITYWPGHALSGNSVPATDLIWSFFAAHPKP